MMVGGDIAYCWYEEDCSERHFSFSCEMDLSNRVLRVWYTTDYTKVMIMFIILSEQLIMVELSKTALDYRPL